MSGSSLSFPDYFLPTDKISGTACPDTAQRDIRRFPRLLLIMHAYYSNSKLGVSTNKPDRNDHSHDSPSIRRGFSSSGKGAFGSLSGISTSAVSSPTGTGGPGAFGLGTGAFASFGSKTPKTPGATFDTTKPSASSKIESGDEAKDGARRPAPTSRRSLGAMRTPADPSTATATQPVAANPLQHGWRLYYRPPSSKNSDYEASIKSMWKFDTVEGLLWCYKHTYRPSKLDPVSDLHLFREGVRPVWEDDANKEGGKFTLRLKKGVADRYWEWLLLAIAGEKEFEEDSDEVCGAVVSVRQGEDVISIWTKHNAGRNAKIRDTIRKVLKLPQDTIMTFKSHNDAMDSDKARADKTARRNTIVSEK